MPLADRIKYKKATLVYKALHDQAPEYMTNMFMQVNQVHGHRTRQSLQGHLYPMQTHLEMLRKKLQDFQYHRMEQTA